MEEDRIKRLEEIMREKRGEQERKAKEQSEQRKQYKSVIHSSKVSILEDVAGIDLNNF